MMKHILFAGVTALAIVAAPQAYAQSVGVGVGPGGVSAGIDLAPDQRTRIREYVVRERVSPITVRERVTVGSTLPADVELRTVPADWGPSVSRYRYVYYGDRVHLVEPSSRRVIEVIE